MMSCVFSLYKIYDLLLTFGTHMNNIRLSFSCTCNQIISQKIILQAFVFKQSLAASRSLSLFQAQDPHPITSTIVHDDTSTLNQSDIAGTPSRNHQGGSSGGHQFQSPLQKDCYMVFRSLCRLSMKGVSDIHDVR